ncbi:hypothetical protein I4U23_024669 [Adineta vaga]|nr:hypothetical protein I4U23_024669 [Adineta vaga]
MFNELYSKDLPSDIDEEHVMLSIHNQTGFDIIIYEIQGIQFRKNEEPEDKKIHLKTNQSIQLTIFEERLSATHLPAVNDSSSDRILKLNDGRQAHYVIYKEEIEAYSENTDEPNTIDLNIKGHGIHNEHMIEFTNLSNEAILIDNGKTLIDVGDNPFFIRPKKFDSDSHKKKGHIRLFYNDEDETISQWSESFSLDVIKSTMASCKVNNDRTYTICIDIVTSSFSMTKIITLIPSTAIYNNSSLPIQVSEFNSDSSQLE